MIIDETKYLMEALENVKERDRIIKCNTIDRVLEIIERQSKSFCGGRDFAYKMILADIRAEILDLKG